MRDHYLVQVRHRNETNFAEVLELVLVSAPPDIA